ncbi:MAG: VOC family protein [Myxococcota bacterium]|nr:VOC family protein [Myxococcota bacterium]
MTTHLPGKFVWLELLTDDAAKAKGFYGELFGWTASPMPMGDFTYEIIQNGGAGIGGYAASRGQRPQWHAYVSVEDVDATAKRIEKSGGAVIVPAFDVPGVGRMAAVRDPQGASFSIMRSAQDDAPDAPAVDGAFYWNELWTEDDAAALAFYEKALGYTHEAMDMGPMGTYRVLEQSGSSRGGIMKSPDPKAPPMWLPYVRVKDTDATAARAEKLGATVLAPPSDIPGIGRFAVLADPQGAAIAIITPPPS